MAIGDEPKPNTVVPEKTADKEQKERKTVRILLAEDNESLRKMYEDNLQAMGYKVDVVGNGSLLLEKLKDSEFDVVLTDDEMPVMTGTDALKRISEVEKYKKLRVIVMTLNSSPETRKEVEKHGGIYISKSQSPSSFYEEIEKVIGKDNL